MSKYIDAEIIHAEIERQKEYSHKMSDNAINSNMRNFFDGADDMCNKILNFIDSQPEEKSSKDLEDEIATWIPKHIKGDADKDTMDAVKWWGENIARHFYELGQQGKIPASEDLEEAAEHIKSM